MEQEIDYDNGWKPFRVHQAKELHAALSAFLSWHGDDSSEFEIQFKDKIPLCYQWQAVVFGESQSDSGDF